MAIIKFNNQKDKYSKKGKYKDGKSREDVYDYIMDASHPTDSKKLVHHYTGGSHVDLQDPVKSMENTAKHFNKDRGVRIKHFIVSFSENDLMSPASAKAAAQKISDKVGQVYENVFAVHEDTDTPHVHFMMSTVSHINGYKYDPKIHKEWIVERARDVMEDYGVESFRSYGR